MTTKKPLAVATVVALSIMGASAQAQDIDNTSISNAHSGKNIFLKLPLVGFPLRSPRLIRWAWVEVKSTA